MFFEVAACRVCKLLINKLFYKRLGRPSAKTEAQAAPRAKTPFHRSVSAMQQLPQQPNSVYRQPPTNLQPINLPSHPSASSAVFADNRNSGYARQLGPSASLPSSPFDGPAAQAFFQRSDVQSYAQPISPMSPIGNPAGCVLVNWHFGIALTAKPGIRPARQGPRTMRQEIRIPHNCHILVPA